MTATYSEPCSDLPCLGMTRGRVLIAHPTGLLSIHELRRRDKKVLWWTSRLPLVACPGVEDAVHFLNKKNCDGFHGSWISLRLTVISLWLKFLRENFWLFANAWSVTDLLLWLLWTIITTAKMDRLNVLIELNFYFESNSSEVRRRSNLQSNDCNNWLSIS